MSLPLLARATEDGVTFMLTPRARAAADSAPAPRMPLRAPGPGEQYRFHVDMGKCIGCKCCVVACNEQNGNPAGINWRRVAEIEGGRYPRAERSYLSIGCHHWLEMNPRDRRTLGLKPAERVEVISRRGTIRALDLRLTETVGAGQVFAPFHWAEANANQAVILGPLAPFLRQQFGMSASAQGLLVAVPLLGGWTLASTTWHLFVLAFFLGIAGALRRLPLASRWYPVEYQGLAMGIVGAGNSGLADGDALRAATGEAHRLG